MASLDVIEHTLPLANVQDFGDAPGARLKPVAKLLRINPGLTPPLKGDSCNGIGQPASRLMDLCDRADKCQGSACVEEAATEDFADEGRCPDLPLAELDHMLDPGFVPVVRVLGAENPPGFPPRNPRHPSIVTIGVDRFQSGIPARRR